MRIVLIAAIFVVLGVVLFSNISDAATPLPSVVQLSKRPYQLLHDSLKDGISSYDFLKKSSKINTFSGFESYFKKATTHNPLVFRQGGSYAPQPAPTGYPIFGPPFDIPTPTGVIPGCLNLLCPPPQGALWVAGICWCTP